MLISKYSFIFRKPCFAVQSVILACLSLTLFASSPAFAEKADKNQPTNIEADKLYHDDLKQLSIFTGRVVMTKGTLILRGDRLEVRQDAQGYQYGVVTAEKGKRAFYRQKRDSPNEEYSEGEAETIDYNGLTDQVKFIKRAELRRFAGVQLADHIVGDVIVYNNATDVFTVDGAPKEEKTSSTARDSSSQRIRVMLAPRSETPPASSASSAPSKANSPQLSPSLKSNER